MNRSRLSRASAGAAALCLAAAVAAPHALGGSTAAGPAEDPHQNHFLAVPDAVATSAAITPAASTEDPAVVGQWSAPFPLGVTSIHTVVLPGGKVLMFDTSRNAGGRGRVWDPETNTAVPAPVGFQADVFCSAHTVLQDGRVFTAGGHLYGTGGLGQGSRDTALFDPQTGKWTAGPLLLRARWYPSVSSLPDGRVLIFGGQAKKGTFSTDVEVYDPRTNAISVLPTSANRNVGLYPRLHALPNGKIWMAGPKAVNAVFDPATNSWRGGPAMKGGERAAGASLLLPGGQRILAFGGGQTAKSSAEVLDTSAAVPGWRLVGAMTYARNQLSATLLPDGSVLAVGGGLGPGQFDNPVRTAERWDPATETWTPMAAQTAPRMYHSTAVLLPDGRVLSSGQSNGPLADTGEIYSPPYLFQGPRPQVDTPPPAELGYGQNFAVGSAQAAAVAKVALVKQAAATHVTGFDQRFVYLPFSVSAEGQLSVTAPAGALDAPAGWYMLFLVDGTGVPSVASWVHLSDSPAQS